MSASPTRLPIAKSERVLKLTASCIRTAIRLRLGHDLSADDALDLARRHDVASAVESLATKLRVHENLPAPVKISVAISEAKLSNAVNRRESLEHIIQVRAAAVGPGMAQTQTEAQREAFINALQEIRREATRWASEYQRFSDDLLAIYRDSVRQLKQMSLSAGMRAQAMAELETIITNALRRGSQ